MNFTITPPAELKLPEPSKKAKVPYYDETEPLGFRCLWTFEFLVYKDDETIGRVRPLRWSFNSGATDKEKLPDEYLLCELEDVCCRGVPPFAGAAAQLYFQHRELKDAGDHENWRWTAIDMLSKAQQVPPERISKYNPPNPKLLVHTMKRR